MPPAKLLASLAASGEARLRLAIIPLLLHRPDLAVHMPRAMKHAPIGAQLVLMCFYTAARYLQSKHRIELARLGGPTTPLPDLFSGELGLGDAADPDAALVDLARRHAVLSGQVINWLGTYRHAADRWLRRLAQEREWAT